MKIGVLKETVEGEQRVAVTPETVKKLVALGFELVIEKGAGLASDIADEEFSAVGAQLQSDCGQILQETDILLKVNTPSDLELDSLQPHSILIGLLKPLTDHQLVKKLAEKNITSLSMEMVPRIARAQKLDALSSQSSVAGYKAVLMAANSLKKMTPMLMTAAGTISPAKVLVLGAGVAGLQAIATAKRLGAVVEAFDVRPVVKEQVESLGAKFLSIEVEVNEAEDKGGYAKELSEDQHQKELALIAKHASQSDIIITTALIPGRPSPILITDAMVKSMRAGSVIVDMAVEGGGNCEISEPGQNVARHQVLIYGELNIPSLMASQSTQLYARNLLNLIQDYTKDRKLELDFEDEIIQGSLLTHKGEIVNSRIKELIK